MSSKTWAKIVLYKHERSSFEGLLQGGMFSGNRMLCVYFNKLQSVCEIKLGAWGLKTRFDMLKF